MTPELSSDAARWFSVMTAIIPAGRIGPPRFWLSVLAAKVRIVIAFHPTPAHPIALNLGGRTNLWTVHL
jgi:hypothetical protein